VTWEGEVLQQLRKLRAQHGTAVGAHMDATSVAAIEVKDAVTPL